MTCSCTNSLSASYWLVYHVPSQEYVITQPFTGGAVLTSCGGALYISLGPGQDCALLTFTKVSPGPPVSPLSISGSCPCEVSSGGGVFQARFQPPAGGSCTYWWTLYITQPTCRIKIVVSKS
jgi:hypothetical protein